MCSADGWRAGRLVRVGLAGRAGRAGVFMLSLLALLVPVLALLAPHAGVAFAFYGRDRGGVAGCCLVLTAGTSKANKGTSKASKGTSKASKEAWLGAVSSSPQVLVVRDQC